MKLCAIIKQVFFVFTTPGVFTAHSAPHSESAGHTPAPTLLGEHQSVVLPAAHERRILALQLFDTGGSIHWRLACTQAARKGSCHVHMTLHTTTTNMTCCMPARCSVRCDLRA